LQFVMIDPSHRGAATARLIASAVMLGPQRWP
jgi:hypothetical protein